MGRGGRFLASGLIQWPRGEGDAFLPISWSLKFGISSFPFRLQSCYASCNHQNPSANPPLLRCYASNPLPLGKEDGDGSPVLGLSRIKALKALKKYQQISPSITSSIFFGRPPISAPLRQRRNRTKACQTAPNRAKPHN